MNKFLKRIFFDDTPMEHRAKSPMMSAFNPEVLCEYVPINHQTRFRLSLNWHLDLWVNSNHVNDNQIRTELYLNALKALQREIFGDIEGYCHELQIHLHNEDYESSKKVVDLIKLSIKGD